MKADYLKVPGARIYFETRGSGPVLLMIPGGPTDADVFAAIAPFLRDHYTVVTYDPRGISRSTLEAAPEDWRR
jgi:pimeloyl-ACP methyl ester carboxylesterase